MTRADNYLRPKHLHIRKTRCAVFFLIGFFIFACHKEKFAWKTKRKNTLEQIEEKDSVLRLEGVSNNMYGYSPDYPIKLGVTSEYLSASYPEKYLRSITGPQGEEVIFERVKSCCPFKTVNSSKESYQNVAVLEIYRVTYKGLEKPIYLYINFFDQGKLLAPKGFLPKPWNP